ncbi:MAG: hypothetical protein JRG73_01020 [Deltaproteobacteria bacterium]|nr:hypothetical protein [Deltaproteobacteria bacterium]MBW2305485.1 hypothetical protein [Deltaproteobacteria bacterium]
MARLRVHGRGVHRAKPLVASRHGRFVVRATPTTSFIYYWRQFDCNIVDKYLLIKVDQSITYFNIATQKKWQN